MNRKQNDMGRLVINLRDNESFTINAPGQPPVTIVVRKKGEKNSCIVIAPKSTAIWRDKAKKKHY